MNIKNQFSACRYCKREVWQAKKAGGESSWCWVDSNFLLVVFVVLVSQGDQCYSFFLATVIKYFLLKCENATRLLMLTNITHIFPAVVFSYTDNCRPQLFVSFGFFYQCFADCRLTVLPTNEIYKGQLWLTLEIISEEMFMQDILVNKHFSVPVSKHLVPELILNCTRF